MESLHFGFEMADLRLEAFEGGLYRRDLRGGTIGWHDAGAGERPREVERAPGEVVGLQDERRLWGTRGERRPAFCGASGDRGERLAGRGEGQRPLLLGPLGGGEVAGEPRRRAGGEAVPRGGLAERRLERLRSRGQGEREGRGERAALDRSL